MLKFKLNEQIWPIRGEFRLSRGARTEVHTLQMQISNGMHTGQAEAVPYARYGENLETVKEQITSIQAELESGITRQTLARLLPAGAARNLCDLALWDLEAKTSGLPVWSLAGLPQPRSIITAYTLSLADPMDMASAAKNAFEYPLLKLKLGTPNDALRLQAIKAARPDAQLIVDANEGWSIKQLLDLAPIMHECGVVLCEQPLPADDDHVLKDHHFPFLICADESVHVGADIPALADRYQAVNLKLDKTGGLTAAIEAIRIAREHQLQVMIGCMLASSLALAPAVLLAGIANWVDLDGPLLLAADHQPGLEYEQAKLLPPKAGLWG